jgi:glycosyltransferase involved in cell wall biosynthesis
VPHTPVVLYAGSLFNRRLIPELIAGFALAARDVAGARLVLAGDNRTLPPLDPLAIAAAEGVSSQVEWRRYVNDLDLSRLYADARAFVFLSTYEGFGMTPMEAIAAGCPAVLLDTPVSREVYGDGARFVTAAPAAIASALVTLLTDDAAREELLARGRARLAHFSWAATAATLQSALEQAAGRT